MKIQMMKRIFKMTVGKIIDEMEACEQAVYNSKRIKQEFNDTLVNMVVSMGLSPEVKDMENEYQKLLNATKALNENTSI